MSFISDILGAAKDNFKGGVATAVNQLGTGDVSGALGSLQDIPGTLLNNLAARGSATFGDGFSGINAREDAVQDWNWYCILPRVGNATLPWYYVTGANTPFRKFNVESLKRNGHTVHYPESYETTGTLQLKFFVDTSSRSANYLKNWQRLVVNDANPSQSANQGLWGLPASFKKSITIAVMSVTRKDLLIFKYLGSFPSDPSQFELGAGSANPLELTVDFQIEDVDLTVRNGLGLLENIKDELKGRAISALEGGASSFLRSFR